MAMIITIEHVMNVFECLLRAPTVTNPIDPTQVIVAQFAANIATGIQQDETPSSPHEASEFIGSIAYEVPPPSISPAPETIAPPSPAYDVPTVKSQQFDDIPVVAASIEQPSISSTTSTSTPSSSQEVTRHCLDLLEAKARLLESMPIEQNWNTAYEAVIVEQFNADTKEWQRQNSAIERQERSQWRRRADNQLHEEDRPHLPRPARPTRMAAFPTLSSEIVLQLLTNINRGIELNCLVMVAVQV
jgi:hypothetical protein